MSDLEHQLAALPLAEPPAALRTPRARPGGGAIRASPARLRRMALAAPWPGEPWPHCGS